MRKYTPKEVCKLLGINYRRLQRWDLKGRFIAHRSDTNRRYYTKEQIDEMRKLM